ncbi:MAG TPA: GNAT family N-acetyltransferase [Roseiflexaceae bacterium]|nr:GNAT family N-acetyltransferase [Roseiflexaceae bacterium]
MVQLTPMTEAEFQAYLQPAIEEYGQDHVTSGRWSAEEANEKSAEEYRKLLPDGLASPDQHLFSIKNEQGENVGMLWFAVTERSGQRGAFIYDVKIYEQFQRRGYATQSFQVLEPLARDMGLTTISLHVFGHNTAARALYEKLGFVTKNIVMSKTIGEQE